MKNHLGSANTTFLRFKANIFLVLVAVCFTLNACTENPKDENETLGTSTPNGFFGNMQSPLSVSWPLLSDVQLRHCVAQPKLSCLVAVGPIH